MISPLIRCISTLAIKSAEEVSQDVTIDYDKSGAPVGIDIQHASVHADIK